MVRLAYAVVASAALLTGCTLDFGDDGGDDQCLRGTNGLEAPAPELLNPETLVCEAWGGGGCDPACGQCPPTDQRPVPTWAYCYGGCEALDEATCMITTACRATYDFSCYTGDAACTLTDAFIGCYGVDQSGPIQGACAGLDAWSCSQHDDCIALHTPQCSGDPAQCWKQFVECRDEVFCYEPVTCEAPAPACPPDSVPAIKNGCYTGDCIPLVDCEPCPTTDCG